MKRSTSGFTIVELIVVIVIIGILSSISIVSYSNWQVSTISAQLKSDLNGVASAMESARTFNNTYPSSIPATFKPSQGVTLAGGGLDSGDAYCIEASSSQNTSLHFYIDQSLANQGAKSGTCSSRPVPVLTATPTSSSTVNLSWTAMSGATSYTVQMDSTASFSTAVTIATQSGLTFVSAGLAPGSTYYYRVEVTGSLGLWSIAKSATTTITAPSAPTVSSATAGSLTTWSWNAATCTSGTTARYQYDYTISPSGYDSGWTADGSSTSVFFTTSTGWQTYTVNVQAQCYVDTTSSAWSTSGSAGYYRASGTAIASDLVSGKTATVDAGAITGTMTSKVGSSTVVTPSSSDVTIPQGYYGGVVGDGRVIGSSNLVSGNIKNGIGLFGVTGNYVGNGRSVYTASGTFVVPSGVTLVYLTGVGSGGNGGVGSGSVASAEAGGSGGGSAGQEVVRYAVAVTAGNSIPVTVGSGSTVFGSYLTLLKGGNGATGANGYPGPAGGGGSIAGSYGAGGAGGVTYAGAWVGGGGGAGGISTYSLSMGIKGAGGSSSSGGGGLFGGGSGGSGTNGNGNPGSNATSYGSGGGGGAGGGAGGSGGAAGLGANGLLIVEW